MAVIFQRSSISANKEIVKSGVFRFLSRHLPSIILGGRIAPVALYLLIKNPFSAVISRNHHGMDSVKRANKKKRERESEWRTEPRIITTNNGVLRGREIPVSHGTTFFDPASHSIALFSRIKNQ